MEQIIQIQRDILEATEKELREQFIATDFLKTENGYVVDMLTAMFSHFSEADLEVIMEMMFFSMDVVADNEQILICDLTLMEGIGRDALLQLNMAITAINAFLPLGAFSTLGSKGALRYRLSCVFPIDCPKDKLLLETRLMVINALSVSGSCAPDLSGLINGKCTVNEIIEKASQGRYVPL